MILGFHVNLYGEIYHFDNSLQEQYSVLHAPVPFVVVFIIQYFFMITL